ncbi:excinuclease ABC subunit UvrA [Candidatus Gracilibacteria bacterium]|nr:excinuclease ABC subunit UvrA [Candidatus Gracilibacteria bacterium]
MKKTNLEQFFGQEITFQGVRTNNLKNIDIAFPKNQIITMTGVSGSGKSSLAFETIYKEGQFRYIESLSSYLRQFFNLGERPDIDHCTGLSPAIAIEQNKKAGNSRSSVGTLTEIDDYIRLLFAKLGDTFCYSCGNQIKPQTVDQILKTIQDNFSDQKIYIIKESGKISQKTDLADFVKKNRKKVEKGAGFTRYLLISNKQDSDTQTDPIEYFYLETPNVPSDFFPINIYGIYDRITINQQKIARLKEDIIKILGESNKFGIYITESIKPTKSKKAKAKPEPEQSSIHRFTDKMYCPTCNITYPEFTPQHFSPNRQEGACTLCHGIGEVLQVDMDKILDPESSYIRSILPWRDSNFGQAVLRKLAEKYSMNPEKKRKDLPEWFLQVVLYGDEELIRVNSGGKYASMYYKGIEDIIKDQYVKGLLTVDFQAMLNMKLCPDCNGAKLKKESLNVFLNIPKQKKFKYNIWDLQKIPMQEIIEIIKKFKDNSKKANNLIDRISNPLLDRISTIDDLGLGYLMLNRGIDTLSGGEIQRLRLAKQLGNKLTGIIYVLDEPTIGLDQKEIQKAINSIKRLKEMGNTIVVVEHNEEFIKASDRVIEIGPGAGDFGGDIMFNGPYKDFLKSNTLTAQYINGTKKVKIKFNHKMTNKKVKIKKASKFNLQNIDVDINLGSFTIITGPSGAGKTTLMYSTLYKFLNEKEKFTQGFIRLQLLKKGLSREEIISASVMRKDDYKHYENLALQEFYKELGVETISGHENIKNTIYVDQTSIGKTPRSCPTTFIGTFNNIRNLFGGTTESKYLGFTASHFSFNSSKGACPACQGYGYKKVELQFLPDTYIACELCKGKRYKNEILGIKRRGKNISQILEMYVSDALEFFSEIDHIKKDLQLMVDIGLGYLKMGQPAHTLSGGESQRLKLIKHLLKDYRGHTVYFLDEPTVGLHPQDIEKLLYVLREFLDNGDTILMIEHDKNIINYADNIIHLENGKLINNK